MKKKLIIACVGIALMSGVAAVKTPVMAQDSAYPGLLVPQKQDPARKKAEEERPGYRGLIPGWLPGRRSQQEQPDKVEKEPQQPVEPDVRRTARTTPWQTTAPQNMKSSVKPASIESKARSKPYSVNDLKVMAMVRNEGSFTIEDSILENVSLPPFVIDALSKQPTMRKDGLSSAEYIAKIEITKAMNVLQDTKNAKERKETAAVVDDFFESLIDRYQNERDIPQRVKEKVGLPKVYIERRNQELTSAIKMVEDARKTLRSQL
ncbi:MAG: hypothetical protein EP349_04935 [Alphaproteobacteria bacterium]|nr:MAG: hypothetical protein EP349_04935 [Alphaproteobacteria bacterium]